MIALEKYKKGVNSKTAKTEVLNYDKKDKKAIIEVAEYRKILGDNQSSNDQIQKKLKYLEALCRNIINREIVTYVEKRRNK